MEMLNISSKYTIRRKPASLGKFSLLNVFFCLLLVYPYAGTAQTFVDRSDPMIIDFGFPKITISRDLLFNDQNNNKSIDPGESDVIAFFVGNEGEYKAKNVMVKIRETTGIKGLTFNEEYLIGAIDTGKKGILVQNVIKADSTLESGTAHLVFDIVENNVLVDSRDYIVKTTGLIEGRNLRVISHPFYAARNRIEPGKAFRLKLVIRNDGEVDIQDVAFDFKTIPHLLEEFRREEMIIPLIRPGEFREMTFDFRLGINYTDDSLPLSVEIKGSNEKEGSLTVITETVFQR